MDDVISGENASFNYFERIIFLLNRFRAIGIPEMLKTLDSKLHVDTRVSNLLVPLGAAMERMGSCVFIVLSALFLIQLEGISLPGSKILLIG